MQNRDTTTRLVSIALGLYLAGSPAIDRCALAAESTESRQPEALPAAPPSVESFNALISDLVRRSLPEAYEDTRDWGKTKEVFDGLHIHRDGLRIKTKRRKKRVNHGTWRRFRVTPVDPEREFHVELQNARRRDDGRIALDLFCDARFDASARMSRYNRGVQVISLSSEADARVQLRIELAIGIDIEREGLLPVVAIKPEATAADLRLVEFRLRRISKLDGPLIRELSGTMHDVLSRKLASRREKIVAQLNRQIAKREDRLQFSLSEFASSGWDELKNLVAPAVPNRAPVGDSRRPVEE